MTELVETLKKQHQAVLKLVSEIDGHVHRSDGGALQKTLMTFKTGLLAHLALEDSQLYPELVRFGAESKESSFSSIANAFSNNMKRISEGLVAFLGRHDGTKHIDIVLFAKEWPPVVELLAKRIQAEESTLYPLYEKATRDEVPQTPPNAAARR